MADQDVSMDVRVNFGDARLKPSDASFLAFFSNVDNFRPTIYFHIVTSYQVVDPTGIKVHVKFGDSKSHRSRDIRLPHFVTNNSDDNDDAGRRATCQ